MVKEKEGGPDPEQLGPTTKVVEVAWFDKLTTNGVSWLVRSDELGAKLNVVKLHSLLETRYLVASGGAMRPSRRSPEVRRILDQLGLGDMYPDLVAFGEMNWVGPVTIGELLDLGPAGGDPWPPDADGVYLVTRAPWNRLPDHQCVPLYVGSNTGKSARFRTRIGDLIADAFGFFGAETGHSSGGQHIHEFCRDNALNPKELFIGWVDNCRCLRCAENYLYAFLEPELNINRPNRCGSHPESRQAFEAFSASMKETHRSTTRS